MRTRLLTVVAVLILTFGASAQQTRSWDPSRTWVYFVGLLEWKDSKSFESFPQENRRDKILFDLLRSSGVPADQMMYLKDAQATTAKVRSTFPQFLRRAEPGDTVIVYFCGHGAQSDDHKKTFFVTYDASEKALGWEVGQLTDAIEHNFSGSEAILMADNCYSGALVDAVSKRANSDIKYAVLASTTSDSESTGNWTFTESLIYAFRGDAFIDDDRDGVVTFKELEDNARDDMLFGEEQIATFGYTGGFDRQGVVATARKSSASRLGERIEAYSSDDYYKGFIIDSKGDKFRVRYYGFEESDDEWVSSRMIRRAVPKQFRVGTHVKVETEGKWYAARVVQVRGGAHYVTYDGYGHEYDEWVSSDRVKASR